MKKAAPPPPERPARNPPRRPTHAGLDQQDPSLRAILLALSLLLPAITLALYLRQGFQPIGAVATGLWLVVLILLWMLRQGRNRHVPGMLASTVLLAGIAGVVADGSVRSSAVLVIVTAVVGTGIYLSRKALFRSGAAAMTALALLNVAEQQQWMGPAQLPSDGALWLTQSAVVLCLIVLVLQGRRRLESAYQVQQRVLDQSEAAVKAMGQSEALFAMIFRNNPAATLAQKLDTREVLAANDEFLRLLGYPREDLIGQAPPGLWADPEQHAHFRELMNTVGRVQALRAQGLRADGSQFEALVFSEVVHLDEDQLIITMLLDMTAETLARTALDKSEERFAKAFNFSPLGMTITRLTDGKFLEVNPANERVLGYSREDFLGMTSVAVGVWLSKPERKDYIDRLRTQGRLLGYETRLRHKQGHAVNVRIWSERIEIDNEACNLSFTMNVDEEKRREALLMNIAHGVSGETGAAFFRSAVQALATATGAYGVLVADLQTPSQLQSVALYCDGAQLDALALPLNDTPFEQVLKNTELVFIDSEHDPRLLRCPTVSSGRPHLFGGVALRDHDGSAIGLLAAFWREQVDISPDLRALMAIFASRCNAELVRLHRDQALRQLQDTLEQRVEDRTAQLEQLNRELDTFAYSVSHDLKSPLRSIGGFMQVLQDQLSGRLQAEDEAIIEQVGVATRRMNSLINDLLALARVSQTQLQRSLVNLSDIAADVIRQEQQRNPGRTPEVHIEPRLMADCDSKLAHIVMENLIGNAWKYTRHQPKAVIRIASAEPTPQGAMCFCVQDNGAGFDMARADRLFKPFNRLHSEQEFEGSGVGLATVRRIVERHGGHIRAEAVVGQGASFWLTFGQREPD